MFRKYIGYILQTIQCRFDKAFSLQKAQVKWIRYQIEKGNTVSIEGGKVTKCSFSIGGGKNNKVNLLNHADMAFSDIHIYGENNTVVLNGCSGILSLTLRGNNNHIEIGRKTSMEGMYMISMGVDNKITIGANCMISGDVEIWNTDSHLITDLADKSINPSLPVEIGDHVWIGKHVKILKGVQIGDGSIIGMSSVVTKDVSAHAIAAGNPARVVKENCKWKHGFIEI